MAVPAGVGNRPQILIVDDEPPIRLLLKQYLTSQGFDAEAVAGGAEALECLRTRHVDLVLSDLTMPGMSGIELLEQVRRDYPDTGVLMLTGCGDVSMAVGAMKTGALDYLLKPFQLDKVKETIQRALQQREEQLSRDKRFRDLEAAVAEQAASLQRVLSDLDQASEGTLEALVAALDAREHETLAHSKRVSDYTVLLAQRLGVAGSELETIRRGAMLHDIGKIGVSDNILMKPGPLTDQEWSEMRRHPQIGAWIMSGVESLRPASGLVLSHHERYDGMGYPRGLKGDQIPLGARIFSVVDTFDAIVSDRPYKHGGTYEQAVTELERNAGTQFDPQIVNEFKAVPREQWEEIRSRSLAMHPPVTPEITPLVLN